MYATPKVVGGGSDITNVVLSLRRRICGRSAGIGSVGLLLSSFALIPSAKLAGDITGLTTRMNTADKFASLNTAKLT